jgi:hypothetical protein
MERFWAKVKKGNDEDCWEWQGSRNTGGYGWFWLGSKPCGAHRVSYQLAKGSIPDGLEICHNCNNRLCVNPMHLRADTRKANMQDAILAGTKVMASKLPTKLNPDKVRLIRRLYLAGVENKTQAAFFGVSTTTISLIARHKKWKHVR